MSPLDRLKKQITKDQLYDFRAKVVDFFNKQVIENLHSWDIIVTIHRKGEFVFKDLISEAVLSEDVLIISNYQICEYQEYFEKKNVLLFDDSINTTETIQGIINHINTYNTNSLSVATILANKSTYEKLKGLEINKNIKFMAYEVSSNYKEYFFKFMCPYFDYICLPATKDLIVEKLTIFKKLSYTEIIELFSSNNFILEDEKPLFQYEDRFKLVLDFLSEAHGSSVFFSEDLCLYGFSNLNLSQNKIRFFVHLSDNVTYIYTEYIVEPFKPSFENCSKKFQRIWCLQRDDDDQNKCLMCLQYNLTEILKKYITDILYSKKIAYKLDSLPWIFHGFLIDTEM